MPAGQIAVDATYQLCCACWRALWTEITLLSAPRLSALAYLNAWDPIRDIALTWWRQGNYGLGDRLLRPIDCGSAALCILVGQAPEELLQLVRRTTANSEGAASRIPFFCKLEPGGGPATATAQSVTTPVHQQKKQRYVGVALGDAALVNICVHSVVPYCVSVLQSVQLSDTMPITRAGMFDGLLRWALRLKPMSIGLNLNSLLQNQQRLLKALDEATVSRLARSLDWCKSYPITQDSACIIPISRC